VRRNAGNIMMKNLLGFSMSGFAISLLGFGIMFRTSDGIVGGSIAGAFSILIQVQ